MLLLDLLPQVGLMLDKLEDLLDHKVLLDLKEHKEIQVLRVL